MRGREEKSLGHLHRTEGQIGRFEMTPFPNKKYQIIYADPPWKYGIWGKANPLSRPNSKIYPMPYPTMTIDEICKLDVFNLADDNCELYLWITQRYLPYSFKVIESWKFKYCQTLVWCKTPRGLGQGGIY